MNVELMSWCAGLLILFSSLPQILANLRSPEIAKHQSPWRNIFQCAGNLLWLLYAIHRDIQAMKVFASLGALFAFALFVQVLIARRNDRD